jgi:glycosyltransferase involved in cell wall biosynthesis
MEAIRTVEASRRSWRVTPGGLRISAVVPCFNGAAYLEEALASVGAQSRPPHEVIVVDDGSTDASAEVAERCGARVIRHGVNRGSGAARNTGWRAATGDAIAWLDADDSWRPHHVAAVGGLLEDHPEAACAFGALQRYGLDDELVTGLVPAGDSHEMLAAAFTSWLHASTSCIVRRAALERIGGYAEGRLSVDFDLYLRLARHHRFVATHEVTGDWRWHDGQLSATPVAQILELQRYRLRFLKSLRAEKEDALARELQSFMRSSWTAHVHGVQRIVEQRKRRALESLGQAYQGPTLAERARWAALSHLPPAVIKLIWPVAGRVLEA